MNFNPSLNNFNLTPVKILSKKNEEKKYEEVIETKSSDNYSSRNWTVEANALDITASNNRSSINVNGRQQINTIRNNGNESTEADKWVERYEEYMDELNDFLNPNGCSSHKWTFETSIPKINQLTATIIELLNLIGDDPVGEGTRGKLINDYLILEERYNNLMLNQLPQLSETEDLSMEELSKTINIVCNSVNVRLASVPDIYETLEPLEKVKYFENRCNTSNHILKTLDDWFEKLKNDYEMNSEIYSLMSYLNRCQNNIQNCLNDDKEALFKAKKVAGLAIELDQSKMKKFNDLNNNSIS